MFVDYLLHNMAILSYLGEQEDPMSFNPYTNRIEPGKETNIVIDKGKTGLGLSIVGGTDTQLVSSICMYCLQQSWQLVSHHASEFL